MDFILFLLIIYLAGSVVVVVVVVVNDDVFPLGKKKGGERGKFVLFFFSNFFKIDLFLIFLCMYVYIVSGNPQKGEGGGGKNDVSFVQERPIDMYLFPGWWGLSPWRATPKITKKTKKKTHTQTPRPPLFLFIFAFPL